jgi:DNA-directed RNA polymerase subunit M/transcription elongation factor TFIIS
MTFFMLNQLQEGKNIFGRELDDPNFMRKDIKVKQATITKAKEQSEMGSKKIDIWVGPLALSAACPHCHYQSIVEMPGSVRLGYTESITFWYECEWCGKSFQKEYDSHDELRATFHRYNELRYEIMDLIGDGSTKKPESIPSSVLKELVKIYE